jgi:hypothetical protein
LLLQKNPTERRISIDFALLIQYSAFPLCTPNLSRRFTEAPTGTSSPSHLLDRLHA